MMGMLGANGPSSSFDTVRPSRPRKMLFATQGFLDIMLEPDLKGIGITQMAVAERNQSRPTNGAYNMCMNDAQYLMSLAQYASQMDPTYILILPQVHAIPLPSPT